VQLGATFERYTVLNKLGQGGGSAVYRVRHATLGTEHALKVLGTPHPEERARLLREGRIQASLSHPNLLPVTDVLEQDGQLALLMEYVPGPTLAQLLKQARLDPAQLRRILVQVLQGLVHAHAHGVVHRDIKADNVLMDTRHRPPRARLMDFGVARQLDSSLTQSNVWIGTLHAMSPEQLRGENATTSSDVYALGLTLYRMVTGRDAFDGADPIARVKAMEAGQWSRPNTDPELLSALEATLVSDPDARPSAAALLAELSEAPQAPKAPPSGPQPASLVQLAVASLAVVIGAVWLPQEPRAPEALPALEPVLPLKLKLAARDGVLGGQALALERAAAFESGESHLDPWLLADLLSRDAQGIWARTGGLPAVSVALGLEHLLAADRDGEVRIWELATGEPLQTVQTRVHQPREMKLSPEEEWFVLLPHPSMGSLSDAVAWNLSDGSVRSRLHGHVRSGELDRHGQTLAAILANAEADRGVWDVRTGEAIWTLSSENTLTLSDDGCCVAITNKGRTELRRLSDRSLMTEQPYNINAIASGGQKWIRSTPSGELELAFADERIVDLNHEGRSSGALFSGDAASLLVLGDQHRLLDVERGTWSTMHIDHSIVVNRASPSGFLLGGRSGELSTWDSSSGTRTQKRNLSRVSEVAEEGARVAVADLDGWVSVSPPHDGVQGRTRVSRGCAKGWLIQGEHLCLVESSLQSWDSAQVLATFSPATQRVLRTQGQLLAIDHSGVVDQSGERLFAFPYYGARPSTWRITTSEQVLVLAEAHGDQVWIQDADQILRPAALRLEGIHHVAIVGDLVAVGHGSSGNVSLLDLKGELRRTLTHNLEDLRGVASLTSEGTWVWAGSWQGQILGWDMASQATQVLPGHQEGTQLLALSGDRLLSYGNDMSVKIWDTESGALLAAHPLPSAATDLEWSQDGTLALVSTRSGHLLVVDSQGQLRSVRRSSDWIVDVTIRGEQVRTIDRAGEVVDWDLAVISHDHSSLAASGALNNLRVCRETLEVVPVLPFPSAESVWAPESLCQASASGD
jgi:WD40 repeat protein